MTIKVAIVNYEHALASSIVGISDIFSIVNHFYLVDENSSRFHVDILHTHTKITNFNMQINFNSIKKVLQYLKKHFKESISIKDMARLISVSERTLLRYFKKATGELPNQYVQKLRVEEAKHLLLLTHDSFEYITYDVGYSNTSTFRNLFKRLTGLTPKEYRGYFMVKV